MKLDENIYRLRMEHNLSQEQFAELLGVSRQSVSKWETGTSIPDLDKLMKMCDIFTVSLDELTGRTEHTDNKESDDESHSVTTAAAGAVSDKAEIVSAPAEIQPIINLQNAQVNPSLKAQHIAGIVLLIFSLILILVPVILLIPRLFGYALFSYNNTISILNFILLYFVFPICLTCSIICLTSKHATGIKCFIAVMLIIAILLALYPVFSELVFSLFE